MVDIVTLYEDPWVNPTGSQDVPHHLNPYIYAGIGDAGYKPLYGARLCTLTSALSCIVTEEINGIYTLDMEYPIDGVGADYIKIGRVISAKNNPFNSSQLFRIIKITRTLRKTFKVSAEHLSYDLDDYTIQPFSVGQFDTHLADMLSYAQGLDWGEDGSHYPYGYILGYQRYIDSEQGPEYIKQNFPFRFVIDGYYHTPGDGMPDPSYAVSAYPAPIEYWSTKKTMYSEKVSTVREFIGGANTGLLATFGGELWYNISDDGHADVIFTKQRGTNRGFVIKYGKNLMSMTYDVRGGKRHSAWYPYYRYCSNADNHEYLFWDVEDDLMNALDILHDLPVPPFEGQIKRPSPDSPYLVYDHYEDAMTYVNIFPVDITQYADLTLKASGYTWEELVETSDTLSAAEKRRRRVLRSYIIVGGLQSYFEASGASYAPTSSEVTCDFETLYGPGSGNEYKKALEELRLGDTVTLLYDEAGHSEQMRIRKMEYDSVTGRYKKLTLGSIKDKKQSAAASIASSSLHSEGEQEKQYSNAASFTTDVKKIIGQVFDNDVFATTPLGKEYHIDPNTGDPILTINASGIGTIVHGAVDPLYLDAQNYVNLRYSSIDFLLDRTDNNALKLKNPLPAVVTGEDEDKYLYVDDNGYISWDDLRLATSSVVGGIKTGYATSGTNFAVQLDQNGKAYVAAVYGAQDPIYLDGTTFKLRYSTTDFTIANHTIKLVNPLPAGGSDGQVLMWNEGPDWTTLTTSDISNIETWISGKSYATTTYVNEKAAGLSASYAINTSSSVNPAFNVQTASITVTSFVTTGGTTVQASSLKVGDTVYVTNSDIPDRWVGAVTSSDATLYILETAKPAVVDVKFDSTSLLNTSTRVATLNHGKAISFNTTDKAISVNIDTNTMAYVDSDTKIGVDTTKIPLITSLGDLAWLDSIPNNVTGSGTSGYLAKFNGANTITNGPQLGSATTTFLRNDGQWATPVGTTYTASTPLSISSSKVISLTYSNDLTDDGGSLTHANTITAGTASEGGSSRTLAFGGTFKIPSVTYDSHGHITNTGSITLTMPANPDTDTKVTQTATTTSAAYEVLFSATASNSTLTETACKNNNLTFNPSTGNLSSVIYTMMVGTTAKASMQYNSTTDAIDFVFVA